MISGWSVRVSGCPVWCSETDAADSASKEETDKHKKHGGAMGACLEGMFPAKTAVIPWSAAMVCQVEPSQV